MNDWNGCKCSAWNVDGTCALCGAHIEDQFVAIARRIDKLESDKRNLSDRIDFWQQTAFDGGSL